MSARSAAKSASKPPPRRKLDRAVEEQRIAELLAAGPPDVESVLVFAEFIHGRSIPEPVLTLPQLKEDLCRIFGCRTAPERRQCSGQTQGVLHP